MDREFLTYGDDDNDYPSLSEFDPQNWKYCERCGEPLDRFIYDTETRYNKITRKPIYVVHVQCPRFSGPHFLIWPTNHTNGEFETTNTEGYEVRRFGA